MGTRCLRRPAMVGLVALLAVAGLLLARAGPRAPLDEAAFADVPGGPVVPVVRVVDGDTIRVMLEGREEPIRLIGIDTPEVDWYGGRAECYGDEAARFVRDLLEGERVSLEFDRERRDRYRRTLAYAYLDDGRQVNLLLVRRGYAELTIFPPNDRYEDDLRAAEEEARRVGRGLWSAC